MAWVTDDVENEDPTILDAVKARIEEDSDAFADVDLLQRLYEAVTGETLTPKVDEDGDGWCFQCGRDIRSIRDHGPGCLWSGFGPTHPQIAVAEDPS